MNICNFRFKFICTIDPDKENNEIKKDDPKSRYKNTKKISLNEYGNGPFCKFKIPKDLKLKGVYAIIISKEIMYIGETNNLTKRYNDGYGNISPRNCYEGGQSTNCRINNMIYLAIREGKRVELYFYETEDYKLIESQILNKKITMWNIKNQ